MWCSHCQKRGFHNTNRFCWAFKRNTDKNYETGKGGDKEDTKDKTKKRNKARTVTDKKEEIPEDEESEESDSVPFIISRVRWFPFGYTDSDEDSEDELETSNDTDVFFMDSEFETEDDSSEEESGYFTPPNTPEMED